MRLTVASLSLLSLTSRIHQVSAAFDLRSIADTTNILSRDSHLDLHIRRRADIVLNHANIHRRYAEPQAAPSPVASVSSSPTAVSSALPTGTMPSTNDTKDACLKALAMWNGKVSSATGMAVCYDVGFLDETLGEFSADVLIYQVVPATGNWSRIEPKSMNVGLSFPAASVASQGPMPEKRDAPQSSAMKLVVRDSAPSLITNMTFVGQISDSWMGKMEDVAAMMKGLAPLVNVTAKSLDGKPLTTTLSTSEAAFVNGHFADKALADRTAAANSANTTPFVLPGTTFGIFPVGFIITGVWALIFVGAVGFGTFGRYQFRNAFRRKTGVGKAGMKSIGTGMPAAYDQR